MTNIKNSHLKEFYKFVSHLYHEHSLHFLDKQFCSRLSLTLTDDLYRLSTKQIQSIHNHFIKKSNECMNNIVVYMVPDTDIHHTSTSKNVREIINRIQQYWKESAIDCEYDDINSLDKEELCQEIVQHILIRGNIIGALETILQEKVGQHQHQHNVSLLSKNERQKWMRVYVERLREGKRIIKELQDLQPLSNKELYLLIHKTCYILSEIMDERELLGTQIRVE